MAFNYYIFATNREKRINRQWTLHTRQLSKWIRVDKKEKEKRGLVYGLK